MSRAGLLVCLLLSVGCTSPAPPSGRAQAQSAGGKPERPQPRATAPYVQTLQPPRGAPGTSVKLIGGGLSGATEVLFGTLPATFTVDSDTQITATVPTGAVTANVYVTTPVGMGSSYTTFAVLSTALPTISGFSPATGGVSLVITGTGFAGATTVTIDGLPSAFGAQTDTTIFAPLPHGVGTGPVVVTNNIGSVTAATPYVGLPEPRIITVSPPTGKGGDLLTLTGAHFSGVDFVDIGGVPAAFTIVNDSTVTFTIPSGATYDQIRIRSPNGEDTSNLFRLRAALAPTVSSVSPTTAYTNQVVMVIGTDLMHVTSVKVGGVPVRVNAGGYTQIGFRSEKPVSGTVVITNDAGSVTTTQSVTILEAPVITDVQPASGKVGDTITLTGSRLTGATLVHLGAASAAFDTVSDTQLTWKVPAGALTSYLSVDTPAGAVYPRQTNRPFTVLSSGPPTISSFTPASGPPGASITLTGTGFTGATRFKLAGFGGSSVGVTSDTSASISVPAGAPAGPITIITNAGAATSAAVFTPTPPLVVLSLTPRSGNPGATVTLTGVGFTGVTNVSFDGVEAAFTVVNDGQITATVPPLTPRSATVYLNGPNGNGNPVAPFSITGGTAPAPPRVAAFRPGGLGVGGYVNVTGVGLSGATEVSINGVATDFNAQSDSELSIEVPAGATTGVVTVTTPRGTSSSTESFVVLPSASVTAISPSTAKIGDTVTLTGTGLGTVETVSFRGFGAPVSTASDTQLTFVVPPRTRTGTVQLSSPFFSLSTTQIVTVVAAAPPMVSSVYPAKGAPRRPVWIQGFFDQVDAVKFNGVDAGYFFAESPFELFATVPREATSGPITVINAQGTATSVPFTIAQPPAVSSATPSSGKLGDLIAVAGSGFDDAAGAAFGATSTSANVADDANLTAAVPPGARTGLLHVRTTDGEGIAGEPFTVVATEAAAVTDFAPSSGGIGRYVDIAGLHFTGLQEVRFGDAPARILYNGENSLRVTVPPGATSGPITLVNAAGTGASAGTFTVVAEKIPTITSLTPSTGQRDDVVTVTGTDFGRNVSISFAGPDDEYPYENAEVISHTDTTATVKVPRYAVTGPLVVYGGLGENVSTTAFVVPTPPRLAGFSPGSGPEGTAVTLTGAGFSGATAVAFAGVTAPYTVASDTAITTTVPKGAMSGRITVTHPLGTATSASDFQVTPAMAPGGGCGCTLSGSPPLPLAVLLAPLLLGWLVRRRRR